MIKLALETYKQLYGLIIFEYFLILNIYLAINISKG